MHLQRTAVGPPDKGVDLRGVNAQPQRHPVHRLRSAPRLTQTLDKPQSAQVLEGFLEQRLRVLVAGRLRGGGREAVRGGKGL